jgi:hypothetical protein
MVEGPEVEGLALLAGPSDAGAVRGLRRAIAAAGTPVPSPRQPIAVAFAGAVIPISLRALDVRWMLETVLRLKNDREIADACKEVDAVAKFAGEGAWHALFHDRQGRTLVRVAASDSALLVDVAATPSTFVAAAVVRGVLIARQGVTARPEDEVRRMSGAELAELARSPGPVSHNAQRHGQVSDVRWCWVLVLGLLTLEIAVRRERHAAAEEARADAA